MDKERYNKILSEEEITRISEQMEEQDKIVISVSVNHEGNYTEFTYM